MEAEARAMQPQAKKEQELPKAGRGEEGPSPGASEPHGPADALISGLQDHEKARFHISVVLASQRGAALRN